MTKNACSDLYYIIKAVEKQVEYGKFDREEIQQYLNEKMRIRVVARDKTLSYVSDEKKYVQYVARGIYFHFRISKSGKVNILSKRKAPGWIGMDKVFVPSEANDTEDCALTECVVIDIQGDYLQKCIKEDGEFAFYVVKELLMRMSKISSKSDLFVFNNARERLLFYILEYWKFYNKRSDTCRIMMKNDYIADEIGVTSRTLYRELNALKNEGIIFIEKGDITVTKDQIDQIREFFENQSV